MWRKSSPRFVTVLGSAQSRNLWLPCSMLRAWALDGGDAYFVTGVPDAVCSPVRNARKVSSTKFSYARNARESALS